MPREECIVERGRQAALLDQIRRPSDVAMEWVERGAKEWTVTICTADFVGALALIVGLLTSYRLVISRADIRTIVPPRAAGPAPERRPSGSRRRAPDGRGAPARLILDVFDVRSLVDPDPRLWPTFQAELESLLTSEHPEEVREAVVSRASDVFAAVGDGEAKLLPIQIDVNNPPEATCTQLSVRSADTPGFLFAFANALAGFPINIERAEIRTVAGEARDTFWVTDIQRQPIVDERRIHELRVAATLIKQFIYLLPRSPNPGQALRQFNALVSQMLSRPAWTRELADLESPAVLKTLADLLGGSRFLWEDFLRLQHESLFPLLIDIPALATARGKAELQAELRARLAGNVSLSERVETLNVFKDREMFRIDLRHIVGQSSFGEFSRELTGLAEVAVDVGIELAQQALLPKFGRPGLADGRECSWCVCALGKFGGAELGFGSDLELNVWFEDEGLTGGPRPIPNSEYFGLVVQTLLQTLRARQEGVFEIDLRLRPFGKAGALASAFSGFSGYYRAGGSAEQFERLALVRLRPIAGDPDLADRIVGARDRFVYSGQPLNLANILHLRHRQATELVPRGQVNAKYSRGGLVDLEYFIQAWQITAGARDPSLRVTSTREAIGRLEQSGYLSGNLAEDLRRTYDFLRQLIDALRVVRGHAKDLSIPFGNAREFAYLVRRMKYREPVELRDAIARHMDFSREVWQANPPPAGSNQLIPEGSHGE